MMAENSRLTNKERITLLEFEVANIKSKVAILEKLAWYIASMLSILTGHTFYPNLTNLFLGVLL